jgi:hypothetical protein
VWLANFVLPATRSRSAKAVTAEENNDPKSEAHDLVRLQLLGLRQMAVETFWKQPILGNEGFGIYPIQTKKQIMDTEPMERDFNNGSFGHRRNTHRDRLLGFDDAAPGAICAREEPFVTRAVALGAGEKNRNAHGNGSTLSRFFRRES